MTDNPWYSFYVGDYARKTAHLSLLEHGAYRLLLDHYYATRQPLPNDSVKLSRICRARSPSERNAVMSVIAEFFNEDGTLLRHERCDSEVCKLLKYSDSQSAKAKQRHCQAPAAAKPRTRVPQPQPDSSVAKATSPTPTPLPGWMPVDLWNGYLEMRRNKRAAPTDKAIVLLIAKLDSWRAKGHDPSAILSKAITSNWTDLYEPKEERHAPHLRSTTYANQPTKADRGKAAVRRAAIAGGFAPEEWIGEQENTCSPVIP